MIGCRKGALVQKMQINASMKRIIAIILPAFQLMLCAACAGGKVRLNLPAGSDVLCAVITHGGKSETIEAGEKLDELLSALAKVDAKTRESHHDAPQGKEHTKIGFELTGGRSSDFLYLYRDEDGFFIEQPYHGIFSIDEAMYSRLLGFAPENR